MAMGKPVGTMELNRKILLPGLWPVPRWRRQNSSLVWRQLLHELHPPDTMKRYDTIAETLIFHEDVQKREWSTVNLSLTLFIRTWQQTAASNQAVRRRTRSQSPRSWKVASGNCRIQEKEHGKTWTQGSSEQAVWSRSKHHITAKSSGIDWARSQEAFRPKSQRRKHKAGAEITGQVKSPKKGHFCTVMKARKRCKTSQNGSKWSWRMFLSQNAITQGGQSTCKVQWQKQNLSTVNGHAHATNMSQAVWLRVSTSAPPKQGQQKHAQQEQPKKNNQEERRRTTARGSREEQQEEQERQKRPPPKTTTTKNNHHHHHHHHHPHHHQHAHKRRRQRRSPQRSTRKHSSGIKPPPTTPCRSCGI